MNLFCLKVKFMHSSIIKILHVSLVEIIFCQPNKTLLIWQENWKETTRMRKELLSYQLTKLLEHIRDLRIELWKREIGASQRKLHA